MGFSFTYSLQRSGICLRRSCGSGNSWYREESADAVQEQRNKCLTVNVYPVIFCLLLSLCLSNVGSSSSLPTPSVYSFPLLPFRSAHSSWLADGRAVYISVSSANVSLRSCGFTRPVYFTLGLLWCGLSLPFICKVQKVILTWPRWHKEPWSLLETPRMASGTR